MGPVWQRDGGEEAGNARGVRVERAERRWASAGRCFGRVGAAQEDRGAGCAGEEGEKGWAEGKSWAGRSVGPAWKKKRSWARAELAAGLGLVFLSYFLSPFLF